MPSGYISNVADPQYVAGHALDDIEHIVGPLQPAVKPRLKNFLVDLLRQFRSDVRYDEF